MAKFKLTLGRGIDGKPSVLEFQLEGPDGHNLRVTRRVDDKVDVEWEGADGTVESVVAFLKNKYGGLGDIFPGLQ